MITLFTNGHPISEIGVKSLVGYLEFHNIPVRAIYLDQCGSLSERNISQILELTKDSTLVGFSAMSKDIDEYLPLINKIREKQKIPIMLGGIHPTALPKKSLKIADIICVGEGEEPLRQVYEAIKNGNNNYDFPNIGYRKGDEIIINRTTYFADSLDALPFPDYKFNDSYLLIKEKDEVEKIPQDPDQKQKMLKTDTLIFYSQRGCGFSCTYCSNSLYHDLARSSGHKWYRRTSPKRFKEELKHHLQYLPFVKKITINDDDFLLRNLDEIREISEFLKNDLKMEFTINGIPSPTTVTDEKISTLVKNGLTKIGFGVQSGSNRVLKEIYKRFVPREHVLVAAKIVAKYCTNGLNGFYPNYGFILDSPYDTDDDWRESLRLLISLPQPRTINLYSLTFFAGTKLTEKAIIDGYVASLESQFNKKYQDDIKLSYPNTLFYLNRFYPIPLWLNNALMSDFMVKSKIVWPIRYIIKYRDPILRVLRFRFTIKIARFLKNIKVIFSFKIISAITKKTKRWCMDKYELWRNCPNKKILPAKKGWSILIVTDGKSQYLSKMIESVDNEMSSSEGEIIVAGPPKMSFPLNIKTKIVHVKYRSFGNLPAFITLKKNLGVKAAKYDKVAICHDYLKFAPGWLNGFKRFGDDFEVCSNKITAYDGSRYNDWSTLDYPGIGMGLLPYETECAKYQYISGTYFVVKRDFYLQNPLNEKLRWGEAEDAEWSRRVRQKTSFKFNPFSEVVFLKQKSFLADPWRKNTEKLTNIFKDKKIC